MDDDLSVSRPTVSDLAELVGFDVSEDDIDRMLTAIDVGLSGYSELESVPIVAVDRTERDPPPLTMDPDETSDPYNAFITRFDVGGGQGSLKEFTLAIKDNIAVGGVPMTCGSDVFADAVPEMDAEVVERLLGAGARILGKTNMDELAYGPTGETSAFGPVENPVVPGHVTGGSSSGSAAAVASGEVDAALGTDTGGSVRIPASFCGLVGFKPTWGVVPQTGVVDLAYTLDHVGVLTRSVETAAKVLDVVVDSATGGRTDRFVDRANSPPDITDCTLGVPSEFFGDHVTDEVEAVIRDRIEAMDAAGTDVRDVSVPLAPQVVSVWNAIVNTEFATFLGSSATPLFRRGPIDGAWHRAAAAGFDDATRQFGAVVQRKAVEGMYLVRHHGAKHYVGARNRARALAGQFEAALEGCDFLVTPTMPATALELGRWSASSYSAAGDDVPPPLAINTRAANVAGIPAVTVPAGTAEDRPIGIQFIGPAHADVAVLGAAAAFERFRTTVGG